MIAVLRSCTVEHVGPCDDVHLVLVGPPLWAIVLGVLLALAAVVALAVLLLRRASRRAPWR